MWLPLLVLLACDRPAPSDVPDEPATTPVPTSPSTPSTEPAPRWVDSNRHVILVSLDGVRWDYDGDTPVLDRLAREGTRTALIPVFPTKTFPNHYTQVTGLYPSEHGIVGNSFYDEDLDASFDMSETGSEWWGGEPIWITAAKQGMRTATMFWPGSETSFDGLRPDAWVPFDTSKRNDKRVEQVLAWFDEEQPPHFTTLYFSDVDHEGHSYGPDSHDVNVALGHVDDMLGLLVDGLEDRGLFDTVDLVVVSDHGMTQLSRDRAIFLDDYVDPDDYWIAAWGPYVTLDPRSGDATGALDALATLPHAQCSDATSRPVDLHFPAGPRIPEILCLAEEGWGITSRDWFDSHPSDLTGATHGYHPDDPDMHGVFYARGPHITPKEQAPFSSVHLYELLAALLEVDPAPNSGDPAVTAGLLRTDVLGTLRPR